MSVSHEFQDLPGFRGQRRQLQISPALPRRFQTMQHHLNARSIQGMDFGTIEDHSRALRVEQRFQFQHEGLSPQAVKLLWQLQDEYGPMG